MIAHTSVAVKDFPKSKELYIKALAPLGYVLGMELAEYGVAGFTHEGQVDFWIGKKDSAGNGHVAFTAASQEEVQAFHKAALEAGATDNGAPGYRKEYSPGYYAAFVHDLDGNNIEAVWMDPAVR
ncbi:MAG TPA: VOC family protein [Candidatus Paceibacterota bacterium]|jgi:catechol 2,3-dioxygenase-like lactoylglutathione lyase family enzyme